ncbi:MAG: hypothetical protein Q8L48_07825 [Archangium sp.]|nr:hypothetical protein [Archangium sp.]
MRTWLVVGALTVMVAATVALRSHGGWSATQREQLEIKCDRRSAEHCLELGLDLIAGKTGPIDTEGGMRRLELACQLSSGPACYVRGRYALELEVPDALVVARGAFERGCRLHHHDACAFAGWHKRRGAAEARDLAGGMTDLTNACGNGSAIGCAWLGETALEGFPTSAERAASARSFERGCELGNDWACLRTAQAIACGRAGEPSPEDALELVRPLCADGIEAACEQQLVLEEADAGLDLSSEALGRAVLRAAFSAAQEGNRAAAQKGVDALDGGQGTLARAAVALRFGEFDQAEALLRLLSEDGGQPEVEVARQTLAARREGQPFPEAAWLGWARAGRPDLRQAAWLPRVRDVGDRGACRPTPSPGAIKTPRDFIRAVSQSTFRSVLDAPFDPPVVHAAMRLSGDADLATRLLALAVLARVAKDESEVATREFEAAARLAFAEAHPETLFFSLLRTPSDLRTGAATEAQVADLERALALPGTLPRRECFDAYARALSPRPGAKEEAFSMTVFVMIDLLDLGELPGWLERGGLPPARRARVLDQLGEAVAGSGWLVDAYLGLRLLRAANSLSETPALTKRIAELAQRLEALRTGPTGVQALGHWPWNAEAREVEAVVDREMTELARLKALSETLP